MNLPYLKYRVLKPFRSWENKYLKAVAKKEAKRFNLFEETAQEISEYTREPLAAVKEKHHSGPQAEKTYGIFHKQQQLTKESVESFYRDCHYYLYELPLWNAETSRPKYLCRILMPRLEKLGCRRVMDFGAGAGDLCIELAGQGYGVTYCDIGDKLISFAKWRFSRRGLKVEIIEGIEKAQANGFDAIAGFDVFEHVKDLPQLLQQLHNCLNQKGLLIFSGAFSGGTLHLEENERYNTFKELDELLVKAGFSFYDKFAQYYFYRKG